MKLHISIVLGLFLFGSSLKGAAVKIKVVNDDPVDVFVTHNVPQRTKADIAAKFTDLNSPFYRLEQAIIKNSVSDVEKALKAGANVFSPCSNGMSPLLLSIILRHSSVANCLINHGARATRDCIRFALKYHDRDLALRLLKTRDAYFDKFAVYSAYVQYSLRYTIWDSLTGFAKNSVRLWDSEPLIENNIKRAASLPNAQRIISLLQELLNVGYTPNELWNAQVNGSLWLLNYDKQASKAIIDFLVQKGARVNHAFALTQENSFLTTPLMQAIAAENIFAIKALLGWGADINQVASNTDCWGITPLAYALQKDSGSMNDIIKLLIEYGAQL